MKALLAIALFTIALTQQIVPIPDPHEGFVLGDPTDPSTFVLDVYFDHLCVDSAAAYPGLMDYYKKHTKDLAMVIHIFPLPFHTYAFLVAQAGKYIQVKHPDQFLAFIEFMFENQSIFLKQAYSWDLPTIKSQIALYTSFATGTQFSDVIAALDSDDYHWKSVVSWKYGTAHRVTGAPRYFVNGIWVPDVTGFTKATEWETFFSGLKPT